LDPALLLDCILVAGIETVQSQVNAQMVECDELICPVHLGKHWTRTVAYQHQQTVTYYDSSRVRVTLLQHLKGTRHFVATPVRNYNFGNALTQMMC